MDTEEKKDTPSLWWARILGLFKGSVNSNIDSSLNSPFISRHARVLPKKIID